jgi:sulfofructose kinase
MKIICVGNSTYDITLPLDKFPIENKKSRVDNLIKCAGGSALNAACLLSKWNESVTFYSVVGKDIYGKKILQNLKNMKVCCKYIEKVKDYETPISFILVNKSNSKRTIITTNKNNKEELNKKIISNADVILLDGTFYLTAMSVINKNKNAIKILDAGKVIENVKKLGKLVDYVICSKEFAEEFTKQKIDVNNLDCLIKCFNILKKFFKNNIIITMDEYGSFTKLDEYKIIPTIKTSSIDSTGAGDIFHGAFAYFITRKSNIEEVIKLSSVAAALSTEKLSANNSIPSLSEVLKYDKLI